MADPSKKQYAPVRASESLLHQQRPTADASLSSGQFRHTIVTTDSANLDSAHSTFADSFMANGALTSGTYSGRGTEMKLTAMEPEPGLPAERPRDYKGRYRVSRDSHTHMILRYQVLTVFGTV